MRRIFHLIRCQYRLNRKSCLLDNTILYKSSVDFLSNLVVVVSVNGKVLYGESCGTLSSFIHTKSTAYTRISPLIMIGEWHSGYRFMPGWRLMMVSLGTFCREKCDIFISMSLYTQKNCIWVFEQPHTAYEIPLHSSKVTVWCGFTAEFMNEPFFFDIV